MRERAGPDVTQLLTDRKRTREIVSERVGHRECDTVIGTLLDGGAIFFKGMDGHRIE